MTGHQGRSKSSLTGALPHQVKKQIVKIKTGQKYNAPITHGGHNNTTDVAM